MMDLLQIAIPVFLALVVAEWVVSRRRGQVVYRLADSLTDVSCGILSQLTGLFLAVMAVGAYRFVGARWTLQQALGAPPWPHGVAGWTAAFLLVDLGQYVVHRLSHRVSFLWACHVVHHSSEEFNYAVALRNTSLHGLFIWPFTLLLAVIGLPWQMFAACYGLNVAYQFWVHTRLVGRLGVLEAVFNTPSHHRVHHGRDLEYVDRNFAGVLIIWDRLFGTFAPERREPSYGIEPRFRSSNPVWANLDGWAEIGRAWRRARDWTGRLAAVFGPPRWSPSHDDPPRGDGLPPRALSYVIAHVVCVLALAVLVIRQPTPPQWGLRIGVLVISAVTLGSVGGLLDGRPWWRWVERARLAGVGLAGVAALAVNGLRAPVVGLGILIYAVASMLWLTLARTDWTLTSKA